MTGETVDDRPRQMMAAALAVAAGLVLLIVFAAGCSEHPAGGEAQPPASRVAGAPGPPDRVALIRDQHLPNVELTTQEGRKVRFYDDLVKGKVVAINFMFATCRKACPAATQNLAEVQDALGERMGRDVTLLSISLDPERDTPEVLRGYAQAHGAKPGWYFLTGKRDDIELLRRKLGAYELDPVLDADKTQHAGIVIAHPHIDDGRQYTVTVHGQDITWDIRNTEVTRVVSTVSAHTEVRAILIAQQREMAQQHDGTVMVGRDIGAVVLPDADLKIYLTASLQERARRRYSELVERLGEHNPTLPKMEEVLADIQRRDEIDHDNMRPAEDAIVIVTDNLSVPQVLEVICSYLEEPV